MTIYYDIQMYGSILLFSFLHVRSNTDEFHRMTLLLGPPSSGKTTLLLALAGKLGSDLQVSQKSRI